MGKKRIDPRQRIIQRSTGFRFYQIEFFNRHPQFQPDEYCRKVVDEQIELIEGRELEDEITN